jgi:hypothetical protein
MINNQWIPVEHSLPKGNTNVLAVVDNKIRIMARCYVPDNHISDWLWGQSYDGLDGDAYVDDDYRVTHWMPLPNLPLS